MKAAMRLLSVSSWAAIVVWAGLPALAASSSTPVEGRLPPVSMTPHLRTGSVGATAVSADVPNDAWAVGIGSPGGPSPQRSWAVTIHWDGAEWSRVRCPNPGRFNSLLGVSAIAPDDAWAVGGSEWSGGGTQRILPEILHWDGTAWSRTELPTKGGALDGVVLDAVSADAPNDVWAVGSLVRVLYPVVAQAAVALHWDGLRWSRVSVPRRGPDDVLFGVWASSPTDAWAVGFGDVEHGHYVVTLTMHWNGSTWRLVPSPNPYRGANQLNAVSGDGAGGAWAVGQADHFNSKTLILHWTGGAWRVVASPSFGHFPELEGVSADAPDDAWAVGDFGNPGERTMILHWDGAAWTKVHAPAPGIGSRLSGVAAVTPELAIAVGGYGTGIFDGHPLLLRWDGNTWRRR